MGANAQTTVPTFTASQVLTADQMNQSARTGVPVFATTVERDAAFGGTGEKTLAEGQLCYLESTNVVQYYDGAAWATVGPASAGGLVFITGTTFTSQTSVSLPNSTFTSTYRNYRILFVADTGNTSALTMRMRAAGTDDSNTSYNGGVTGYVNTGAAIEFATNAASAFVLGYGVASTSVQNAFDFTVYAPQLSTRTEWSGTGTSAKSDYSSYGGMAFGGGFNNTTSFDSLSIISSDATSLTGYYRVYGLADS